MSGVVNDYEVLEQIGHGTFATVWLARYVPTNSRVAVKVISKSGLSADDRDSVSREVTILKSAHHPAIAAFYDFFEDSTDYYIVMELIENGNLVDAISASRAFPEKVACRYVKQIISGLRYLHEISRIVHRDVKCENILLDRRQNVRIIDFGLSFSLDSPPTSRGGTPSYLAPEVVTDVSYGIAVDIWSTGVILYTLIAGRLPFANEDPDAVLREIIYADPVYPDQFSPELVDLLSKMLEKNPAHRITSQEIEAHPCLASEPISARVPVPPMDPVSLHQATIGELKACGIPETPDIENTPAYRIIRRIIETDSRGGLPSLSHSGPTQSARGLTLSFRAKSTVPPAVAICPLVRVPKLAHGTFQRRKQPVT
jgi:5'-AMP-activated protein kinase catalytic alpha subunit